MREGRPRPERFRPLEYFTFALALLAALLLCICVGSAAVPARQAVSAVLRAAAGLPVPGGLAKSVVLGSRLPRVLCAALMGASLSLGGAAMQGLLRNPLADGSTLGISSGASLGAVVSIALGITVPSLPMAGTAGMAMLFAFGSLVLILALAYRLDCSLSTNTIILLGVIFSMFAGSLTTLIITFRSEKLRQITFWTMGSLSGLGYSSVLLLLGAFIVFGAPLFFVSRELNAFAIGEENARSVGVNVRRVKLLVLVCVSGLVGVCVSVGGTIGFVGLVVPHMARMMVGPNHRRLLPASVFFGAVFLLLADLAARTALSPLELPIGAVTSLVGAVAFVAIFFRSRRAA